MLATRSVWTAPPSAASSNERHHYARYDEDGDTWVPGCIDDVMNVSGHRSSTAEVESALLSHPDAAEAAVVGAPDATTG